MNFLRIQNKVVLASCHSAFTHRFLNNSQSIQKFALTLNPAVVNIKCEINHLGIQKRNQHSDLGPDKQLQVFNEILTNDAGGFVNGTVNKLSFLADAPFTHAIENALISLHSLDVLTWPATIFVAAFCFRLFVCFPIKVYQERLMARLINVQARVREQFEEKTKSINKGAVFMNNDLKKKLNKQVGGFFS